MSDAAAGRSRLRPDRRRLRLRHTAEAAELPVIRRRVLRWAEHHAVAEAAVIDLQLALGEAVSNGVDHAYRDGDPGTVDVELELRPGGDVRVSVVDHGRWRPPPAFAGYRGRGLALIETVSEGLQVTSSALGTRICFDIPAGR